MRRIPRIPSTASALCSASTPVATTSAAPLRTLRAAADSSSTTCQSCNFSTQISATRNRVWQNTLHTQRRCASTATETTPEATEAAAAAEVATELTGTLEQQRKSKRAGIFEVQRENTLVLPAEPRWAPNAEKIQDPNYEPATSGAGLQEIGGVSNWWNNPEHFKDGGKQFEYQGYASPVKVTDPRLLKVILRRALVEGLALKKFGANPKNPADIASVIGNGNHWDRTVSVEMCRGENGELSLKKDSDLQKVWILMRNAAEKASTTREWQEQVRRLYELKQQEKADQLVAEGKKLGYRLDDDDGSRIRLNVGRALELRKTWNNDWKEATIRDPVVKFYAAKRIQKMAGHILSDGKLTSIQTVANFMNALVTPPKPKKLAEQIEQSSILPELPNVKVYPRRVTPVDKEKMVGRWKVIQKELEKRALPVLGTGNVGKYTELKWLGSKQ
ncbi:ribosomal subunit 39S-domain-containing protein [Sordaria brevicollis]|uniref:Large ribosomal subunit protein mL50 n=1 Tax=Sordaria brevicollis TaxID=83679 RepID=A0AAE0PKP9_SORBR|nr:ribosomal subunit 39S-domain-containing protein [Sordaria brevicollis]